MQAQALDDISSWIIQGGLKGFSETQLLDGFCERCRKKGLDLSLGVAIIDTLHPIWEGRAFFWRSDGREEEPISEYGNSSIGEQAERWQRSAFHYLLTSGEDEVRRRIGFDDPTDFFMLDELKADGHTDYLALVHRFASDGVIGEMDCICSHWVTRNAAGFSEDDCAALRRLVPMLVLALKSASLARIAGTLVEVYLGKDAGQRVLSGRISRGATEQINAVLWFSDLRGFTTIADSVEPDQILPLLNDYAEAIISAVQGAGGNVMKLIGDGILAIFKTDHMPEPALAALQAEAVMRENLAKLDARRLAEGQPVTAVRLALHIGEVFYGNIGSDERLDFTVVGPAVNEASRIVSMAGTLSHDLLASAEFVASVPAGSPFRLLSVGHFTLRGVSRTRELFTLER